MSDTDPKSDIQFPQHLEPVRLLGNGSVASVWLARDRMLKRLVAAKFLSRQLCHREDARRRFEREAQAAARLAHENITTVYSVGVTGDDCPYIVMEYVGGTNLEDLLQGRGQIDVDEACTILAQVAGALAAAHEQNVVHRDVKPANILVSSATGGAKLTDFGIAAILQTGDTEVTRLTREGERLGDPRYMSPEQLRGEPLTGQSDVYALAVVACEMLTGRGPFDDPEIADVAAAHLRRPPPDLSVRRPEVPQAIANLVKRCLAKKPEHRPQAKDLAALFGDPHATSGAGEPQGVLQSFLRELRQRKVYRAATAYAAITFLLLQVVDVLLNPFPELDIYYRLAVVAAVAGFPVTVVLAWIYDLHRGRLVRTDDDGDLEPNAFARRRRLVMVATGVTMVIAAVAAWWMFGA